MTPFSTPRRNNTAPQRDESQLSEDGTGWTVRRDKAGRKEKEKAKTPQIGGAQPSSARGPAASQDAPDVVRKLQMAHHARHSASKSTGAMLLQ